MQGEGGYLVPPAELPAGLRALCDRHGILLICGRGAVRASAAPGRCSRASTWGVTPDILTLARGLASACSIGMVVAKGVMERWPRGVHGNTFGGNPICCAAALATLDLVEGGYVKNAGRRGPLLRRRLRSLMARHSYIGEVRGKGMMHRNGARQGPRVEGSGEGAHATRS